MNRQKFNTKTKTQLHLLPFLIFLIAFAINLLLTGCASINRREESIESILQKENQLIEKIKAERAQPEVQQAISENDHLKRSEVHLSLGLDEIMKANEVIRSKILKAKKEEEEDGENERIND